MTRTRRSRLLAAGLGPGGARTVYALGAVAAAKAAALVVMAGAIADGVTSVIEGGSGWHACVVAGLIAALGRAVLTWVGGVVSARAALGAKETLRAQLADKLVTNGTRSPGAATVLATRGLDDLDEYYSGVLPAVTNAAAIPLLIGARILAADWFSAVVIVLTVPLVPLFMALVGMYTRDSVSAATQALGRLSDHLVELARGLPVLVGLGRVDEQAAALDRVSDDYRATTLKTLRIAFLSSLVLELISTISVAVVAVFIGLRLIDGSLPLATGLLVLILAPECFAPFRQLGAAFHASQNGVAALESARQTLEEDALAPLTQAAEGTGSPAPADPPFPARGHAPSPAEGDTASPTRSGTPSPAVVLVSGLTVRYEERDRPAVQDLTFEIPSRETTAIVGESGSGKSTVLAVLAGTLADGTDGAHVSGRVLGIDPRSVAWAPQHPVTVGATVEDELRIYAEGIPTELADVRIEELSRQFGFRHLLGDDPAQISLGELRRVAFARALLRLDAGARLLLLDEPTAHLDDAHAAAVREEVRRLHGTVTIVLASHDPSLVRVTTRHIRVGAETSGTAERRGPVGLRAGVPPRRPAAPHTPAPVGARETLRLLAAFVRPARGRYAAAVLLGAGASLFSVSLTALSGWLIVRASEHPNVMLLLVAIVGVRFFGIGRAVLRYSEQLATHDAVFSSVGALRSRLWAALARRGASVRRLLTGGNALDYLVITADRIRDLTPRVVLPIGSGVLSAIGALIAVALLHAPAVPLLAACLAICLIVAPPLAVAADRRAGRERAVLSSTVGRQFTALVSGSQDLRANGVDGAVRAELARTDRAAGARARHGAWALGAGQAIVVAACCATAAAMLPVALPAARAGTLPPEIVAVLALLPLGLIEPLLQVVEAAQQWPALAQSLVGIAELAQTPTVTEAQMPGAARTRTRAAARTQDPATTPARRELHLSIRGLGAGWPDCASLVFRGVDADLRTGDWLVVRGPSGSGKSTLLTVLLGYLDPAEGTCILDGADLRELPPATLRRRIAWAPQEGHLFDSTLRGNLLLARPHGEQPSEQELRDALERVGLGDLLATLPRGLDTRVGPHGSALSGGQRQRLVVARTLLTRADLILLDEPTAHLDEPSAARLMADLRRATGDKITVLVTHREAEARPGDVLVDLAQATARSATQTVAPRFPQPVV